MKYFALILVFGLALPASAQDASTRLKEAVTLERSVGDYEGAIGIYRQIMADDAADRRVVAQAILNLGKAYESLGRTEAFAAYERLARDYGDQEDLVAEARERMRGLVVVEESSAAPENGGVYSLPFRTHGNSDETGMYASHISSSGRYVARESGTNGITVDDLKSGTARDYSAEDLGCPGTPDREGMIASVKFSPDESEIAFQCWDWRGQIGILNRATGDVTYFDPRPVFADGQDGDGYQYNANVIAWSGAGSAIFASVRRWKFPRPASGGSTVRDRLAFFDRSGRVLRFVDDSPTDSSYFEQEKACLMHSDSIMVGEYVTGDGTTSLLMTVDLSSGAHRRLLEDDPLFSEALLAGCDGDVVYFTKKRGDRQELYRGAVDPSGQLQGESYVRELPSDASSVISDSGALFYHLNLGATCYDMEAPLDEDGHLAKAPRLMEGCEEPRRGRPARYLPDGSLVYSPYGSGPYTIRRPDGQLVEVRLPMQEGRTLPDHGVFSIGGSPGPAAGNYLLFRFFKSRHGFDSTWIVDSRSGAVVDSIPGAYARGITPDLKKIYRKDPDRNCLLLVDRQTEESETMGCIDGTAGFNEDIDPKTGHIALATKAEDDSFPVFYVDRSSGEAREVFRSEHGNMRMMWSAGRLYISQGRWGEDGAFGFYRFDPESGQLKRLALTDEFLKLGAVAWNPLIPVSPDGVIRTLIIAPRREADFELFEVPMR